MRVLIVEDDVKLAGLIQRALREQAALADVAHDGEDAWLEPLVVLFPANYMTGVAAVMRRRASSA